MLENEAKYPTIAVLKATGATGKEISKQTEISRAQICRILKKQEVKDIIKACESAIAERGYRKATENILTAIDKYNPDNPVDGEDKSAMQIQEQGFRASLKIAEGIGLIPSNSVAPMVQQINVAGNAQIISPVVDRALSQAMLLDDVPQDIVSEQ